MGLAGRRIKQRIGADPQNKAWSTDTQKIGFSLLQQMGWTPGKGLGASESGITSHIKTVKKVDNSGVGSKRNSSDNWLQNTDAFSQLLADLNAQVSIPEVPVSSGEAQCEPESLVESKKQRKEAKKAAKRAKRKEKETKKTFDSEQVEKDASGTHNSGVDSCKKRPRKQACPQDDETKTRKHKKSKRKADGEASSKECGSLLDLVPSSSELQPECQLGATTEASNSVAQNRLSHARYAARSKHLKSKKMATSHAGSLDEIFAFNKLEKLKQDSKTPVCNDEHMRVTSEDSSSALDARNSGSTFVDYDAAAMMQLFVKGTTLVQG